jgi:hypothetical protein
MTLNQPPTIPEAITRQVSWGVQLADNQVVTDTHYVHVVGTKLPPTRVDATPKGVSLGEPIFTSSQLPDGSTCAHSYLAAGELATPNNQKVPATQRVCVVGGQTTGRRQGVVDTQVLHASPGLSHPGSQKRSDSQIHCAAGGLTLEVSHD